MKRPRCRSPRLAVAAAVLVCAIAGTMAAGVSRITAPAFAQSSTQSSSQSSTQPSAHNWQEIAASEEWMHDITVLTMAFDGSWGAATEPFIHRAIANAMTRCAKMSGTNMLWCGAYIASVRAGWILAFRCGRQSIVVADKDLAEANRIAAREEIARRAEYVPGMPACIKVVTIDPRGRVMPAQSR